LVGMNTKRAQGGVTRGEIIKEKARERPKN